MTVEWKFAPSIQELATNACAGCVGRWEPGRLERSSIGLFATEERVRDIEGVKHLSDLDGSALRGERPRIVALPVLDLP